MNRALYTINIGTHTIYTQNIIPAYCTPYNQGFPAPELVSVCSVALDEFLLCDRVGAEARGQPRGSTDIPRGSFWRTGTLALHG